MPVGNLTPRRDFTDVRDVVRAYRLLIEHGEPGEAYNVCTGHDLAISELADRLLALAARPMRLEADPALQRPVDVPCCAATTTELHKATGWEPEIPLDQTLADLLAETGAVARRPDGPRRPGRPDGRRMPAHRPARRRYEPERP